MTGPVGFVVQNVAVGQAFLCQYHSTSALYWYSFRLSAIDAILSYLMTASLNKKK